MSDASTAIVTMASREVEARDFLPVLTVDQAVQRKKDINRYISGVMTEGEDYGKIPGGQEKKVLMKPGAEKLCSIFGFAPRYVPEVVTEDWTGAQHGGEALFYYRYTCQLWRGDRLMGEAVGSCNSREIKYRFRWISREEAVKRSDFDSLQTRGGRQFEPEFAIDKAETSGKYGKPAEYWQRYKDAIANGTAEKKDKKMGTKTFAGYEIDTTLYRVPNPDVADQINTIQKMAQKRALVAAVLVVTNCSDAFTQDLDESEDRTTEPMPEGVHKIDSGQPKAEPDDETMLGYLKRIEADPKEAATIAAILLDDIENLMGKDMADRTWEAFTRQSGNPPTVEANKKAYWTIAVRALHGNLKELKERAAKQNKA